MPKGQFKHEKKVGTITIDEAYEQLRAAILMQAIADYWLCGKVIKKTKSEVTKSRKLSLLGDCERFFQDPPYDYGDVDTRRVKLMLDVAAEEGFHIMVKNNWRYE